MPTINLFQNIIEKHSVNIGHGNEPLISGSVLSKLFGYKSYNAFMSDWENVFVGKKNIDIDNFIKRNREKIDIIIHTYENYNGPLTPECWCAKRISLLKKGLKGKEFLQALDKIIEFHSILEEGNNIPFSKKNTSHKILNFSTKNSPAGE